MVSCGDLRPPIISPHTSATPLRPPLSDMLDAFAPDLSALADHTPVAGHWCYGLEGPNAGAICFGGAEADGGHEIYMVNDADMGSSPAKSVPSEPALAAPACVVAPSPGHKVNEAPCRPSPSHLFLAGNAVTLAALQGVARGDLKDVRKDAVANASSVTTVGAFILREYLMSDAAMQDDRESLMVLESLLRTSLSDESTKERLLADQNDPLWLEVPFDQLDSVKFDSPPPLALQAPTLTPPSSPPPLPFNWRVQRERLRLKRASTAGSARAPELPWRPMV